jgi:hypothetical protein
VLQVIVMQRHRDGEVGLVMRGDRQVVVVEAVQAVVMVEAVQGLDRDGWAPWMM